MPAPTNHPDWATDGTNVVAAPAGKVAAGWVPGEQPPSGWFNWWQGLVGQWTRWLETRLNTTDANLAALDVDHDALAAHVAFVDVGNVFTDAQTINTPPGVVDLPILTTQGKPSDAIEDIAGVPTPKPTNKWKLIMAVPTSDTTWSGIFVGQPPYGSAFVNNARWHVPSQEWRQLDPLLPSTGLISGNGRYVFSFMPPGAAAWAEWPLIAGGDLVGGGNVVAGMDFRYVIPKPHVTHRDCLDGFGGGELALTSGANVKPYVRFASSAITHHWPLRLPHGSELLKIEISTIKGSSTSITAELIARSAGAGGVPEPVDVPIAINSANTDPAGYTWTVINLTGAPHTIQLNLGSYFIRVRSAAADDGVVHFKLTWLEPGLSCYGG